MPNLKITVRFALLLACIGTCTGGWAQVLPLARAGSASTDRVQRESELPMYRIRVLGETPAPKPAPANPRR